MISNKLGAGYSGFGGASGARRSAPVFWGCGGAVAGRNFGGTRLRAGQGVVRGVGKRLERRGDQLLGLVASSHGFLRFLGWSIKGRRMVSVEWSIKNGGFARFRAVCHLMTNLTLAAIWGHPEGPEGGAPPQSRAPSLLLRRARQFQDFEQVSRRPSPFAQRIGSILRDVAELQRAYMGSGVRAADMRRVSQLSALLCRPQKCGKLSLEALGLGGNRPDPLGRVSQTSKLGRGARDVN